MIPAEAVEAKCRAEFPDWDTAAEWQRNAIRNLVRHEIRLETERKKAATLEVRHKQHRRLAAWLRKIL